MRIETSADEDCVFVLIDSLEVYIRNTPIETYFVLADSIACIADGIVAEVALDLWTSLLAANGRQTLSYLDRIRNDSNSCLRDMVIMAWEFEIENEDSSRGENRRTFDSTMIALKADSRLHRRELRNLASIEAEVHTRLQNLDAN